MKKEVLSELPSKRRQIVLLDPSLIKTKPLERAAKQVANAKVRKQLGLVTQNRVLFSDHLFKSVQYYICKSAKLFV